MRILLAIDHLGIGGAQRQLTNLAVGLRRRDHDVDVFVYYPAADFDAEMTSAGVRIIRVNKRSRYSPTVVFKLAGQLRAANYDVALAYLDTPNIYLELASLLRPSTKIVVSERIGFRPGPLSRGKRIQESFHRLADCVVANSHDHAARLESEFPWMKERVRVIYNGVKPAFFNIPARRGGGPGLRLVVVATVVPKKNALNLARALGHCTRDGLDVHVEWAGRHPVQSSAYIEEVNRALREHGAQDRWNWLGERSDIPALLENADALVHPSYLEGFPNAVCEALAAGRPVLAGDVGDVPLLVQDAKAGYLFDPADVESIATAIGRLSRASADRRNEMALCGRARAAGTLTIDTCTTNYVNLFQSLCQSAVARNE